MNFYTSDLHLGHANVIRFDNRPFRNVEEMDEALIHNWNNRVSNNDTVYIVGDLCYRSAKDSCEYLSRLNGNKKLIIGNHDSCILKNNRAMSYFSSIESTMSIADKQYKIELCHYPMVEWNGYFHGVMHVHGHIHSSRNEAYTILKSLDKALNAGCMINNYEPVTIQELIDNNKSWYNC